MDVGFKTRQLRDAYEQQAVGVRLWGEKIANLYVQRVNALHAASDARVLFALRSLGLHPLKGERKGQHAMRLDGFWRLIVAFQDEALKVVRVEEVSKHYGD